MGSFGRLESIGCPRGSLASCLSFRLLRLLRLFSFLYLDLFLFFGYFFIFYFFFLFLRLRLLPHSLIPIRLVRFVVRKPAWISLFFLSRFVSCVTRLACADTHTQRETSSSSSSSARSSFSSLPTYFTSLLVGAKKWPRGPPIGDFTHALAQRTDTLTDTRRWQPTWQVGREKEREKKSPRNNNHLARSLIDAHAK